VIEKQRRDGERLSNRLATNCSADYSRSRTATTAAEAPISEPDLSATSPLPHDLAQRTQAILTAHAGRQGALLPVLHDVQQTFGYVPDAIVPMVAAGLNLSRAEVHGVISFYHDFRRRPVGRHVVKLCGAEACQARGGAALAAHAAARLAGEPDRVMLETVYCLSLCASGPAALIDNRLAARLDADRFDALIGALA
jgi:formate dehydrogenase subunit gamma